MGKISFTKHFFKHVILVSVQFTEKKHSFREAEVDVAGILSLCYSVSVRGILFPSISNGATILFEYKIFKDYASVLHNQ